MRTIAFVLTLFTVSVGAAQTPAGSPSPLAGTPSQSDTAPIPPPDYGYEPDGRRDPFLSLVHAGAETRKSSTPTTRPDGLGGVLVEEVAVRGIVQSRGAWVAMVAAPSGRSYTVHPGDHLMDGSVRAITADAVVFVHDVRDPLSVEKQREVRKQLRAEVK